MEFLIWLVIVGAIIYKEYKKQKMRDGGSPQKRAIDSRQGQSYRPNQSTRPAQSARPAQNQSVRPNWNPEYYKASQEAARQELLNKQRELKERLMGKYGNVGAGTQQQKAPARQNTYQGLSQYGKQQSRPVQQREEQDIFSRAAANVRENEEDQLGLEMEGQAQAEEMMAAAHSLVNAIDIEEKSRLMDEVNDLMIMGYQANLTFERDFIAEGVEMLSSYDLP